MSRFRLASLGLVAVVALSGCASALEARTARLVAEQNAIDAYNRTVPPEERLQCFWRIPVGSSIKKRICMTKAQIERERKNARDFVYAGGASGPTPGNRGD